MTFRMQGTQIREQAEQLGRRPARGDHQHALPPRSHARESGLRARARVVSTERTLGLPERARRRLLEGRRRGRRCRTRPSTDHEIEIGGKTVRDPPRARPHRTATSSCSSSRTACSTPATSSSTAATRTSTSRRAARCSEWIATLDRVLALDFDRVIPGHGPVTDRAGLRRVPGLHARARGSARRRRRAAGKLARGDAEASAGSRRTPATR